MTEDRKQQMLLIREIEGVGMGQLQRAAEIADARFEGDLLLGYLWTHANAFAINVKGDRAAWNDDWARNGRDALVARLSA